MWETWFDPWVGRIPGEGKGYPLQYSGLENSMDYKVHGVAKSQTQVTFTKNSPKGFLRFEIAEPISVL